MHDIIFGNDDMNKGEDGFLDDKYYYHKHEVNFTISQYFEFFLIHMLHYIIVEPLINLHSLMC